MSNPRGPGQKLISVPMNEKFIEKIDLSLKDVGYSDRSSFIRDAIIEKLKTNGIEISTALSLAPSRPGKGGRPPKLALPSRTERAIASSRSPKALTDNYPTKKAKKQEK